MFASSTSDVARTGLLVRRAPGILLVVAGLLLSGCELAQLPFVSEEASGEPARNSLAHDDEKTVSLTIYLRTGGSTDSMLKPVQREVPIEGDLPHKAVELLLSGPSEDERLEAAWPVGTDVIGVAVDGGVATVDLTHDALGEVSERPEQLAHLESLALGALVNTLTEFPSIDEVRVTVDGHTPGSRDDVADFWGGWGIPESMTRDETLIGEEGEATSPHLDDFGLETQSVGSMKVPEVVVRSVRIRDRVTYVRIVVEIGDAADPDRPPDGFPRSRAQMSAGALTLEVADVQPLADATLADELTEHAGPWFREVSVTEATGLDGLRLRFAPRGEEVAPFHLHTRRSPSRIVLDVKK